MLTESTTVVMLSSQAMRDAETRAMASGISGWDMMRRAGEAVAEVVTRSFPEGPVYVLCGPGNNGGDGFVAAIALKAAGREVTVGCLVSRDALTGDAATAASEWDGRIVPFAEIPMEPEAVYIDAIFGTGFHGSLEGEAAAIMERLAVAGARIVAVDILSGIDATSGAFSGYLPTAAVTVTFGAKKPGHLLMPGTLNAGIIASVDIGIGEHVEVAGRELNLYENRPELWLGYFHWPLPDDHKYSRGSVVVFSGQAEMTGASRLAARAALRVGAGAVSIACDREALKVNAAHVTAIMTRLTETSEEFAEFIAGKKHRALLLGPGAGLNDRTRACVKAALASGKPTVLDADALTAFEEYPQMLFDMVNGPVIMTPHGGELERLFSWLGMNHDQPKWLLAREAAARTGMTAVLKGYDTCIAAPDGRVAINGNGSPLLATAGSGDVLAGIIAGLCAQGMPAFEAACAGVSLHAEAGRRFGLGLIAEDIPEMIPAVLNDLFQL